MVNRRKPAEKEGFAGTNRRIPAERGVFGAQTDVNQLKEWFASTYRRIPTETGGCGYRQTYTS